MKKFNTPEINVVKFLNDDVITTSSDGGYEGNQGVIVQNLFGFTIKAASDQDADIPF